MIKNTYLNDFKIKLLIIVFIGLFILKFFSSYDLFLSLYNTFIEISVLYGFYVLFDLLFQFPKKNYEMIKEIIYYLIFSFNVFIFSLSSYYFQDSIVMKYSLLYLSIGELRYFFDSILQFSFLLGFLLAVFIIVVFSLKINLKNIVFSTKILGLIALGIFISSFLFYPSVANIYTTSLIDIKGLLVEDRIPVQPSNSSNISSFSYPFNSYDSYNLSEQKVLVFVMEQTTLEQFKQQQSAIPEEENFFKRINASSHFYTNYYTTNQDSRTSIWSMFSSQFLPFESYTEQWNNQYGYILEEPNIVDLFNSHNFSTKVAASMFENSLILGAYNWSENIYLKQYPVEKNVCIHEFDFQKGCEDNAIISDVKEELDPQENKIFLFQELIYGHGEKYIEQGEQSKIQYYNQYFNSIYNHLNESSQLEDTTIVIVADHGEKGYNEKTINAYNIPLIVYNQDLENREIDTLYSHLNFKDILLSYISNQTEIPQPDDVFTIGQTQSDEIAYTNNTDFFTGKYNKRGLNIGDTTLSVNTTIEKVENLLYYRDYIRNKSNSDNFYCRLCEQNNQLIKEKRIE